MRGTGDAKTFSNISATPAAFRLDGGLYQFAVKATWGGGNVVLKQLGPDATTYLSVSAVLTADGGNTLYLPAGQYEVVITTATAVYATIVRIPGE